MMALVRSVAVLSAIVVTSGCSSPAKPSTPRSITITGLTFLSAVGQTSQLTAVATLSSGMNSDVTAQAAWQSSNPIVASVSATGLVTALGFGTSAITATYQGNSVSASLLIPPPPP